MSPADDSRFDRLVDGELNETERRALLAGLDDEPGGWRRCALAFLEAQCWKQEFGSLVKRKSSAVAASSIAGPRRAVRFDRFGALLAMAASVLFAFWLGSLMQPGRIEPTAATPNASTVANNVNERPQVIPVNVQPTQSETSPWRLVTIAPSSAAQDASIRLPAMERKNVDPNWLQTMSPAVPDDVLQAFSRTGHQVQQRRELMPVPLDDGRRLIVPVNQVEVKYNGEPTY